MVKKGAKKKWDKIIINIPIELLREFDRVADMQYYSRSEAIKEAMRGFIVQQMPEDYVSPSMREDQKEQAADAMEAMGKGIVRMAGDPEIQKIDARNRLHQQKWTGIFCNSKVLLLLPLREAFTQVQMVSHMWIHKPKKQLRDL